MSDANPNYERTYEFIDLDNPPLLAGETDTHWIYFCPHCIEKRGKPDNDGKLNFSKEKPVGLCFKCNTVFRAEVKEDDTGRTDPKLNQTVNTVQRSINEFNFVDPPPMGFDFPELDATTTAYLKNKRHCFLPMLAPVLGLKRWPSSNPGVVIPYVYKDYIATFQVRFTNPPPKSRKYYIPVKTEKIPYSPEHLLGTFDLGTNDTITICEGWADAVALWIMGYPHPFAIQGSSITEYESMIFRMLMPDNAFIVMDRYEISSAIQKTIRQTIPSIANTKIVCFGEDVDPEEQLKEDIKNPEKFKEYFANTVNLLKDRVTTKIPSKENLGHDV